MRVRRNSGDEEIRGLLRRLNENPNAADAERLAAALRRRDESTKSTFLALETGRAIPLFYEFEHQADMTTADVVEALREAVQNWLDSHKDDPDSPGSVDWGQALVALLTTEDYANAGLRFVRTIEADEVLPSDEGFWPTESETQEDLPERPGEEIDDLVRHYSSSGWAALDAGGYPCPHRHRTREAALACARRLRRS